MTLLEQQLTDKTQSAQAHVQELTDLRSELARERSSVSMLKKELRESVANELGRARALHTKQCAELGEQLERLRAENVSLEKMAVKAKGELKGKFHPALVDPTMTLYLSLSPQPPTQSLLTSLNKSLSYRSS